MPDKDAKKRLRRIAAKTQEGLLTLRGRMDARPIRAASLPPVADAVANPTLSYDSGIPYEGTPLVSVVIPAFNAVRVIGRALDMLLLQSMPPGSMEIVVVDDGSTDDTFSLLARWQEEHPGLLRIARLPHPSGSPAAPRNAGLSLARGTYLFFHDADDWMSRDAIPVMFLHAEEWHSDILIARIVGENGRRAPKALFTADACSIDPWRSKATTTLAPYKLYRRALMEDLRFPPDMPEDIEFTLRALAEAKTISVAADYDYYHLTLDEDEGNASLGIWDDVESCLRSYERIFSLASQLVPPGVRDLTLMKRLFDIDVSRTLAAIAEEPPESGSSHFTQFKAMVDPFYHKALVAGMSHAQKELFASALGKGGSYERLRGLARSSTYDKSAFFD